MPHEFILGVEPRKPSEKRILTEGTFIFFLFIVKFVLIQCDYYSEKKHSWLLLRLKTERKKTFTSKRTFDVDEFRGCDAIS